ncbi:DUF3472 domain-containing protein [Candidatus Microgenomates bacterium]|nr:DUF3472 domain-containing protein [Candidatus Microgenomates bacterium]
MTLKNALLSLLFFLLLGVPSFAANYTPAIDYVFDSNTYTDMTSFVTWQAVPSGTSIFASYQFGFQAGNGGYIGTQIYSNGQKKAIFSIWDVDGFPLSAQPNEAWCQRFGGEGLGAQCLIDYPWVANREYKLVVRKHSTLADGVIWQGIITDTTTGVQTGIGSIKVGNINTYQGFGSLNGYHSNNFHEYFLQGTQDCPLHPYSKIQWRGPYVLDGTQMASKATAVYLDCSLVNISSPSKGIVILEEGPGTVVTNPNGKILWDTPIVTPSITPSPTKLPSIEPTATTVPTIVPTGPACKLGDANHDGTISLADYSVWRSIFIKQ